MADLQVDWAGIFREAWDETPLLRVRHTLGPLAVSMLTALLPAIFGSTALDQASTVAIFGLLAWVSISTLWLGANVFRVPTRRLAEAERTIAERDAQLAMHASRRPTLTITSPHLSPDLPAEFALWVDMENPGESTTLRGDWLLEVIKSDGTRPPAIRGSTFGFHGILETGGLYRQVRVMFPYTPEIPDRHALENARYVLTVSDVRDQHLRAEYPRV